MRQPGERSRWAAASVLVVLAVAVSSASVLSLSCVENGERSDYAQELARLEEELARLSEEAQNVARDNVSGLPPGPLRARWIQALYSRAALTGALAHYREVEQALDAVAEAAGSLPWLRFSRAQLNYHLHRLQLASRELEGLEQQLPAVRELATDVALQEGDYAAALAGYRSLLALERRWDTLARLAYLRANTGHPDEAERLYDEARSALTAKQMRPYAWLELQKGLIDWQHGRAAAALDHYRQADAEYSGYWLIEEHLAEALAATGRRREAEAIYRSLVATTRHPDLLDALARLLDGEAAIALRAQADALHARRGALYPEAAIGHRLEGLLAAVPKATGELAGRELVELATSNYRLRPNAEAKTLLARAHLKAGHSAVARRLLQEVLAGPWRNSDVYALQQALGAAD